MALSLTLGTLSFLFSVVWGRPLIRFLKAHQIGESIRLEGPSHHQTKVGTPTMGGIMIIVPVVVFSSIFILPQYQSLLLPLTVLVATGILGMVDDWTKLQQKRRGEPKVGILARHKMLWLTVIATGAALVLHFVFKLESIAIPTVPQKIPIGLAYVPVAVFIITGTANAVNITDGLDGLAGGTAAIAFAAYGIIAARQGQAHLVTFCFSMSGGILAFLWYNAYPAELFMGDTGSLALGATLGTVALMTGQWLLLPIVGVVFMAEAMSVILQVAYFRYTGGRRLFKMAPIHHHFELLGWSEVQVVQRFWLISMLSGMLGVALALV
ncbi:MAG: phospho-N-acetylmuramoyl-pentapeptide-transferase [Ardenticatenia bacterium]|nr:phospho-N-acetylmuramoyl-pentapeptide-transferase [Ardenticatenia bacterium]